jgi:hypothetical protein
VDDWKDVAVNDKAKDDREATKAVRRSLETAETGHSESAERLNQAEKTNPVATESVEQAVSEGPAGSGLSR